MSDEAAIAKARRSLMVRSALLLALGTIGLLSLFMFSQDLHEADIRLAGLIQGSGKRAPILHADILLIDIPSGERSDIAGFRTKLTALLNQVSGDRDNLPRQIALDIAFSAPDNIDGVARSIASLRDKRIPVFGVCPANQNLDPHQFCPYSSSVKVLYKEFSGVGHTAFDAHETAAFYTPCSNIKSLVYLMAEKAGANIDCDAQEKVYVSMGKPIETALSKRLLSYDAECKTLFRYFQRECTDEIPEFRNKSLILGRLAFDRSDIYPERSGPEVIAWALSNRMSTQKAEVVESPYLLISLMVLTAATALGAFRLLLRFFRQWRLQPWRIAIISGGIGFASLLIVTIPLGLLGKLNTQFTLPLAEMVLVLVVATYYRIQEMSLNAKSRAYRVAHEYLTYDVFISYRSPHRELVRNSIWTPLSGLKRADGSPVNIFWDNESLHRGRFHEQLERAVTESRIFIAILTPDFFDDANPYCRWELEAAKASGCEIIPIVAKGYNPAEIRKGLEWLAELHTYDLGDASLTEHLVKDVLAAEAGN